MQARAALVSLLFLPLLAGCVNDAATYEIDGSREHTLSLIREQPYFWDSKVELSLVVARMPVCLRRHSLGAGSDKTRVEIYQVPSGAFIVKVGRRLYATETQTCINFARIEGEPEGGMGQKMGIFRLQEGKLAFAMEAGETAGEAAAGAE